MLDHSKTRIPERFKDHPIFNELICGTNFGFMAKRGYYLQPEVKRQPELMKQMGINWTTLNMNFCRENFYSDNLYLDFEFSSGEIEIIETVKRLHDNGIRVLFKPCLTSLDSSWMGMIMFPSATEQVQEGDYDYWGRWYDSYTNPTKTIQTLDNDYWGNWFASYKKAMIYFADLSERAGVDALIFGAEYYGMEGHNKEIEEIIDEIRKRYSGPLSYEFTHASRKSYNMEWIKKLDFLSYSYYPPACKPNMEELDDLVNPAAAQNPDVTVEEMEKYLESRKAKIMSVSEYFDNMPIAFTEYGVRSAHGCVMQPYNFMWDTPYDGEEQANYMEASFRTFWDVPQWMGLFWWKWDETQHRPQYHGDPNGDRGFTIQGKPAEAVMRKWNALGKKKDK